MKSWLADSGPLVALLVARDHHHAWAVEQCRHAPPGLLTCEAVLSEVLFLLQRAGSDGSPLFAMLGAGFLHCDFAVQDEHAALRALVQRYAKQPMSLADACLVRMAELRPEAVIWTVDRDFSVYRRHRRQSLPLVAPW